MHTILKIHFRTSKYHRRKTWLALRCWTGAVEKLMVFIRPGLMQKLFKEPEKWVVVIPYKRRSTAQAYSYVPA